jgi:hypothetical protein
MRSSRWIPTEQHTSHEKPALQCSCTHSTLRSGAHFSSKLHNSAGILGHSCAPIDNYTMLKTWFNIVDGAPALLYAKLSTSCAQPVAKLRTDVGLEHILCTACALPQTTAGVQTPLIPIFVRSLATTFPQPQMIFSHLLTGQLCALYTGPITTTTTYIN